MTGLPPDMIERAAKRIVQFLHEDDASTTTWENATADMRAEMMVLADAALTAALGDTHVVVRREPTDEVLSDFVEALTLGNIAFEDEFEAAKDAVEEGYRAMIRAATGSQE